MVSEVDIESFYEDQQALIEKEELEQLCFPFVEAKDGFIMRSLIEESEELTRFGLYEDEP